MDIVDRVRRMRKSLGEVLTNLKSSMSIKSPGEINPNDDLGVEPEPDPEDIFAGISGEEELSDTPEEAGADIDALLGEPPEATDTTIPDDIDDISDDEDEQKEEPKEDKEDILGEKPDVAEVDKPKERIWDPIDSPDGKSLRFKSDKEGVTLDMKMLNTNPFMWLARIQRDDKILDWGTVLIPKDIDDPVAYIKYISNAMLDMKSMRYEQEWQKKFVEAKKKEEEAKEPEPAPTIEADPVEGEPDIDSLGETPGVAPEEEELDLEALLA